MGNHNFICGMTSSNAPNERAYDIAAVLYPDSMVSDWQSRLEDIDIPCAYCIHDKDYLADGETDRKVHVHLILHWSGNTTLRNAYKLLNLTLCDFSKTKSCLLPVCKIQNVRSKYDYLIHKTDKAIKDGKFQYDISERIEINNYDIGAFEQTSKEEQDELLESAISLICSMKIKNMRDFRAYCLSRNVDAGERDNPERSLWDVYSPICRSFHAYLKTYFLPNYDDSKKRE